MTPSDCKVCGRSCAVGMQSGVKVGSRWITWRECPSCFFKEQRRVAADKERG